MCFYCIVINSFIYFNSLLGCLWFQYAAMLDGILVMVLTLKASLKELGVLLSYIMMGMFLFSTLVTFVEYETTMGEGVPDSLYGK